MAAIVLDRVTKRYPNGHIAVDDLSLEIAAGELLVGPLHGLTGGNMQELDRKPEWHAHQVAHGAEHDAEIQAGTEVADIVKVIGQLASNAFNVRVGRQLHLGETTQSRQDQ